MMRQFTAHPAGAEFVRSNGRDGNDDHDDANYLSSNRVRDLVSEFTMTAARCVTHGVGYTRKDAWL